MVSESTAVLRGSGVTSEMTAPGAVLSSVQDSFAPASNEFVRVENHPDDRVADFVIGPLDLATDMGHLRLPIQVAENVVFEPYVAYIDSRAGAALFRGNGLVGTPDTWYGGASLSVSF